jgi:sulfoacetaldehyde dehydrogenase
MNAPAEGSPDAVVAALIARARAAQREYETWSQERVDEAVTAAGWAIVEPGRNNALAELAVRDTGLGSVADKMAKNHRKTLGLLRDLRGAKSVGVISEDRTRGLIEIARPVGVVAAITPSTNPAATPANNIINALKGATRSSSRRRRRARPRFHCCFSTSVPSSVGSVRRVTSCRCCRRR